MPTHKITLEFAPSLGLVGQAIPSTIGSLYNWTESWYDATLNTNAESLEVAFNYSQVRRLLLTSGWRVKRIKTSVFPGTRVAARRILTPADGIGRWPLANPNTIADEQPYDAVNITANGVSGRARVLQMRGIAPEVVTPGGLFANPAAWAERLQSLQLFLVQHFDIRVQRVPVPIPIEGATLAPTGTLFGSPTRPIIVVARQVLDFSVPPNNVMRVAGILGMGHTTGTWTCDRQDNTFVIGGRNLTLLGLKSKRNKTVVGSYTQGGTITQLLYDLDQIQSISTGDGASRRTGGPISRPRGRRSARAS